MIDKRDWGRWTAGGALPRRAAGLALGLGWLGLALAGAWGQSPAGGMKLQIGERPIEVSYDKHEIKDFGNPDETHYISGSPACATAYLEGGTVVLTAPFLSYSAQQGIFHATSGVTISDGTLTVQARQGRFDLAKKEARFREDVRWERRHKSGQTSRGRNEFITVRFGKAGAQHILFGSGSGQPGRMFLFPEKGAMERLRSGEGSERSLPEPPRIERALVPLEQ